jgi:hypothetical protein
MDRRSQSKIRAGVPAAQNHPANVVLKEKTVSCTIEAAAEILRKRESDVQGKYEDLLAKARAGERLPAPDAIARICEAAGKTPADLAAIVAQLSQRDKAIEMLRRHTEYRALQRRSQMMMVEAKALEVEYKAEMQANEVAYGLAQNEATRLGEQVREARKFLELSFPELKETEAQLFAATSSLRTAEDEDQRSHRERTEQRIAAARTRLHQEGNKSSPLWWMFPCPASWNPGTDSPKAEPQK